MRSPSHHARVKGTSVALIMAVFAVLAIAVLGAIGFSAHSANRSAVERETALLDNALGTAINLKIDQLRSIAWWDDAVIFTSDVDWNQDFVIENFGWFLTETYTHGEVYVLNGTGDIRFSFAEGEVRDREDYIAREPLIAQIFADLRSETDITQQQALAKLSRQNYEAIKPRVVGNGWSAHYTNASGRTALMVAMQIVPNVDMSLGSDQPGAVVALSWVDEFVADMSRANLLADLNLTTADSRQRAAQTVGSNTAFVSRPLAFTDAHMAFIWSPHRPGDRLLFGAMPLALGLCAMTGTALWALLSRLRGAMGQLARQKDHAVQLAQEAQQANQAKDRFLSRISHELLTPLNGVVGMLDALKLAKSERQTNAYLKLAKGSANTLSSLVNDILEYTRIETQDVQLDVQACHLPGSLRALVHEFSATAEQKGLALSCEIAPNVPDHVAIDGRRVAQVVASLLDNAIKFTNAGQVVLRVSLAGAPGAAGREFPAPEGGDGEPPERIRVEVVDTGAGIAPEIVQGLFERFVVADDGVTREHGGLGLGLAISHKLIAKMGGILSVTSTPGQGSVFWFEIPAPPMAGDSAAAQAAQDAPNRSRRRGDGPRAYVPASGDVSEEPQDQDGAGVQDDRLCS